MKFNTLVPYNMEADVHYWEEELRDGQYYRKYDGGRVVRCTINISIMGSLSLYCHEQFQPFSIISELRDSKGDKFLDEVWYSVTRVQPVFDAMGTLSSYNHTIAPLAAELIEQPITPRAEYPQFDQTW